MTPDLEIRLTAYLTEMHGLDLKGTLGKIYDQQMAHEAKDGIQHAEILGHLRGHSLRIGELEKDKDKLEGKLDDTGNWHLNALKEQSAKSKDLVHKMYFAVGGGLFGAVVALLSMLLK